MIKIAETLSDHHHHHHQRISSRRKSYKNFRAVMAKLLLSFKEICVAESNGNVRIVTQAQK